MRWSERSDRHQIEQEPKINGSRKRNEKVQVVEWPGTFESRTEFNKGDNDEMALEFRRQKQAEIRMIAILESKPQNRIYQGNA